MTSLTHQDRFLALVEEHKGILYKVANAYCKNRDDRPDLIQEIIAQLWRSFARFDERRRFSTWMYRIALNLAISFYRRENRRIRDTVPVEEGALDMAEADQVLHEVRDDVRLLRGFIDRLDELNRAIIILYLDGCNHDAIAEIVGISTTNVSTRINRIKQKLQRDFDAAQKESGTKIMNLEELRDQWMAQNDKLEKSLRLNAALWRESGARKARGALSGLSRAIWIELMMNFVAVILLGSFIADHIGETRFLVPAIVLDLFGDRFDYHSGPATRGPEAGGFRRSDSREPEKVGDASDSAHPRDEMDFDPRAFTLDTALHCRAQRLLWRGRLRSLFVRVAADKSARRPGIDSAHALGLEEICRSLRVLPICPATAGRYCRVAI